MVLLDALQVLDGVESLVPLLVDNVLELLVLVVHLLDHLFLNAFLLGHLSLHLSTTRVLLLGKFQDFLKLVDLLGGCLLKSHSSATRTMVVKVAVIAECLVMITAISLERVRMLTHSNIFLFVAIVWLLGYFHCFYH